MAKVVLCQPVYGHVPPAAHIAQVELVLRGGASGHLIGIVTARDTYIDWGRNHIISLAYGQFPDFTHLLWVDGDIIAPHTALDTLLEHMADDMGAIGGLYVKKGKPYEPVAYDFRMGDNGFAQGTYERTSKLDVTVDALYEVQGLGMGLTLVRREMVDAVLEKTRNNEGASTPFQTTVGYGEDVWFFHWAVQAGFRTYLDTSVRCRHIGDYEFSVADWERAKDEG